MVCRDVEQRYGEGFADRSRVFAERQEIRGDGVFRRPGGADGYPCSFGASDGGQPDGAPGAVAGERRAGDMDQINDRMLKWIFWIGLNDDAGAP